MVLAYGPCRRMVGSCYGLGVWKRRMVWAYGPCRRMVGSCYGLGVWKRRMFLAYGPCRRMVRAGVWSVQAYGLGPYGLGVWS